MSSISAGRLALRLSTVKRAFAIIAPEAQVGIADLLFTQDGQGFSLNQNPLNVLILNQDISEFSLVLSQDGDILIDQIDRPFRTQQFISSS
jgi:hypothetical protein